MVSEKIEDSSRWNGNSWLSGGRSGGGCPRRKYQQFITVENSYSAKANIKPLIDEAKEKYGERTLNLPGRRG